LKWLFDAHKLFPKKEVFFLSPKSGNMEESFFMKLYGDNAIWSYLLTGGAADGLRKSWEPKLSEFKKIRKKYLLYDDFE
jgi:uncharacterized protein YbbC (DUF1343 family)